MNPSTQAEDMKDCLQRSLNLLYHRFIGDDEFMEINNALDDGQMNFGSIKEKIDCLKYRTTVDFLIDIVLMKRCAVTADTSNRMKRIAKEFVDYCENEILLIDACGLCYDIANNTAESKWFSSVCGKRHPVLWAKVTGYPYEPAKQMKIENQMVTVHFFGDHKIANVPRKQTMAYSETNPNANYQIGINVVQELRDYVKNLEMTLKHKECGKRVEAPNTLVVEKETTTPSRPIATPLPNSFRQHIIDLLDKNDERFDALNATFLLKERAYKKEIAELQGELRAAKKRKWCDTCSSSTETRIKIFCSNSCGAKWYANQSSEDNPHPCCDTNVNSN